MLRTCRVYNARGKNDRCLIGQSIVLFDLGPGMLATLRKIVEGAISLGFCLEFLLEVVYCIQHEVESREPVTKE